MLPIGTHFDPVSHSVMEISHSELGNDIRAKNQFLAPGQVVSSFAKDFIFYIGSAQ